MELPVQFSMAAAHNGAAVQTRPGGRSAAIDLVKGLAITLVVIGHHYPVDCPGWWQTLHDLIYAFHMPIFFFAAGYIWHMRTHEGYGGYLTRKMRRLLVPCLSVIALYVPVKLAGSFWADLGHPVNVTTLAKVVTDPAHSFLPFLWFFYVLFVLYAVFPAVHRWGPRAVWLSMIPAGAAYLCSENYYVTMTSIGYLYFTVGTLLAQRFHLDLDKHIPGRVVDLALLLALLFLLVALLWKPGQGWSAQPRYLLVSILGTTAAILWCQIIVAERRVSLPDHGSAHRSVIPGFLVRVGASSMTVCLFHTLFAGTAKAGLNRVPLLVDMPFIGKAILCILAGILLPLALEAAVLNRVDILRVLFLGEAGKGPRRYQFDQAAAWTRSGTFRGSLAGLPARRL